jgi:hypothetical protein
MGASQSSTGIKSFPFRAEGAALNAALYPQGNAIFSISPTVIESFNVQDSTRNWVVYLEGICSSAFDIEQTIVVAGTTEGIVRFIDVSQTHTKQYIAHDVDITFLIPLPSVHHSQTFKLLNYIGLTRTHRERQGRL